MSDQAACDPERWTEVWSENPGDYYAASIQVNKSKTAARIHSRSGLVTTTPLRGEVGVLRSPHPQEAFTQGYNSGYADRHDGQSSNPAYAWTHYQAWLKIQPGAGAVLPARPPDQETP